MADVGADIESLCRKCGDVWHVVVAKVGAKIAKVQCKQCGGLHRYRPPDGAAPSPSRTTRKKAAPRSKAVGKSTSASPMIPVDASKPLRPYRISEIFAAGDRVSHRTFGEGLVEMEVGQQKIQVFFPGGRKVLAHGR